MLPGNEKLNQQQLSPKSPTPGPLPLPPTSLSCMYGFSQPQSLPLASHHNATTTLALMTYFLNFHFHETHAPPPSSAPAPDNPLLASEFSQRLPRGQVSRSPESSPVNTEREVKVFHRKSPQALHASPRDFLKETLANR